jgi:hypothetical protein
MQMIVRMGLHPNDCHGRVTLLGLQVSFMLPASTTGPNTLEIAVHALGRFNFGCVWDTKGLQNRGQLESSNVTLNSKDGNTIFAFTPHVATESPYFRACR